MKYILSLLLLLMVSCQFPLAPVTVHHRSANIEYQEYYIHLSNERIVTVSQEVFARTDVGDRWND